MNKADLKTFLDEKALQYEVPEFIKDDPIQIPKMFTLKEDVEISGFLTSIIAWGQRKTIIKNSTKLMQYMDNSPHDFLINHKDSDLKVFENFVHRTFNSDDLLYFIYRLSYMYKEEGGIENSFNSYFVKANSEMKLGISLFKESFFSHEHLRRSQKHLPNPMKGSAAKRFNMYLRWMVRPSDKGVDFGIWKSIDKESLYLPLDVHSGNVARKLGLLLRNQSDWKALEELMVHLRKFDPKDPSKYDFALFGMGVNGDIPR